MGSSCVPTHESLEYVQMTQIWIIILFCPICPQIKRFYAGLHASKMECFVIFCAIYFLYIYRPILL